MPAIRKKRIIVSCQNPDCSNTFEIIADSKYSKKYCSRECARKAKKSDLIYRRLSRNINLRTRRKSVSAMDLQKIPINLGYSSGKFVTIINQILDGKIAYIGVR